MEEEEKEAKTGGAKGKKRREGRGKRRKRHEKEREASKEGNKHLPCAIEHLLPLLRLPSTPFHCLFLPFLTTTPQFFFVSAIFSLLLQCPSLSSPLALLPPSATFACLSLPATSSILLPRAWIRGCTHRRVKIDPSLGVNGIRVRRRGKYCIMDLK